MMDKWHRSVTGITRNTGRSRNRIGIGKHLFTLCHNRRSLEEMRILNLLDCSVLNGLNEGLSTG